ncbi:hypothetical protein ACH5BF_06490 [Arcobacter sp. YIC-464]|uniref:hypothetical protein n=1 Tax=Arcobacter sp. YIC-464 TaxID=3376631 RepID=UPI003C1AFD62
MNEKNGFLKKLISGKLSLNIVFWIYFVLLTLVLNSFIDLNLDNSYYELTFNKEETIKNLVLFTILFLYTIFIFVAVIKTANNYKGSKFLSFFAKLIVTFNLIITLFTTLDIVKTYALEDYFIQVQIDSYKDNLPIKVNSYTNLKYIDKVEKKIEYTYQIINKNFSHVAALNLKSFEEDVQNSLCEDETTKELLKKDYILQYNYLDNKEKELIKITTTKTTCGPSIYDLDILKDILYKQGQI